MYLTTGTELGFFTKRDGVEGAGIPSRLMVFLKNLPI